MWNIDLGKFSYSKSKCLPLFIKIKSKSCKYKCKKGTRIAMATELLFVPWGWFEEFEPSDIFSPIK